ncbi:hypothetical protein BDZ89DRAFT_1059256, partial [Hymenopellis radicata]
MATNSSSTFSCEERHKPLDDGSELDAQEDEDTAEVQLDDHGNDDAKDQGQEDSEQARDEAQDKLEELSNEGPKSTVNRRPVSELRNTYRSSHNSGAISAKESGNINDGKDTSGGGEDDLKGLTDEDLNIGNGNNDDGLGLVDDGGDDLEGDVVG